MTIIQRIKKIFTVIVYFASVSFRKNWKESSNYYTQKHHMDCIWVREFNSFHGWSEKKSDLHTYICRIILYYDIYFARLLQFRGNWKDFERYLQIICFKNSNNNVIISTLSGFLSGFFIRNRLRHMPLLSACLYDDALITSCGKIFWPKERNKNGNNAFLTVVLPTWKRVVVFTLLILEKYNSSYMQGCDKVLD